MIYHLLFVVNLLTPFAPTFMQEKIIEYFCRVGDVSFTRNYLTSKYVRREIVEDIQYTTLEDLVQKYEGAKFDLKEQSFNVDCMFDAEIATATN